MSPPTIDDARWPEITRLFDELVDLDEPARDARVAAGVDPANAAEVRSLVVQATGLPPGLRLAVGPSVRASQLTIVVR